MSVYTVHEAETQLSKLMERAARGEEIIITRGDEPAMRITPVAGAKKPKREPGGFEGQIIIHDSFFEPMTEEELALWEGGPTDDSLSRQDKKPGA